jgi:hypothetical protein
MYEILSTEIKLIGPLITSCLMDTNYMATKKTNSHVHQLYISKIAEKSPQQQFQGERTISAVITL